MVIEIKDDQVMIDGVKYVKADSAESKPVDLIGIMNRYHGAKEYDATVEKAITWYYGYMAKVSWCAIFVSWCAYMCGILDKIGGKNDNVNSMRQSCLYAAQRGEGEYFDRKHIPDLIKKNDILFFTWEASGIMTDGSSKHVAVAEYDSSDDYIYSLGGNQRGSDGFDKVCTKKYDKSALFAVYRMK